MAGRSSQDAAGRKAPRHVLAEPLGQPWGSRCRDEAWWSWDMGRPAGYSCGRGFGRSRPLQGTPLSRSECGSLLFAEKISPRNPASPGKRPGMAGGRRPLPPRGGCGVGGSRGRVEERVPHPALPLCREFINGSDAFCAGVAGRLLAAMLEKLRGAAGSDGQQCQILQQVSGIEVRGARARGPSGLRRAGLAGAGSAREGRCPEPVPPHQGQRCGER